MQNLNLRRMRLTRSFFFLFQKSRRYLLVKEPAAFCAEIFPRTERLELGLKVIEGGREEGNLHRRAYGHVLVVLDG